MIVYDDGKTFVVRRPIPGAIRYFIYGAEDMDWPEFRDLARALVKLAESEPGGPKP